jgi:hypothetical protein
MSTRVCPHYIDRTPEECNHCYNGPDEIIEKLTKKLKRIEGVTRTAGTYYDDNRITQLQREIAFWSMVKRERLSEDEAFAHPTYKQVYAHV